MQWEVHQCADAAKAAKKVRQKTIVPVRSYPFQRVQGVEKKDFYFIRNRRTVPAYKKKKATHPFSDTTPDCHSISKLITVERKVLTFTSA